MRKQVRIRQWIGKLAEAALTLAVLAGLYLTLVTAQPREEADGPAEAPASLSPSASRRIDAETDLRELVREFPGPVLSFMSGSGMVFVSGQSEDAAWSGGLGRVLTLFWQTREGAPVTLRSIWPSQAAELLGKGDYAFSGTAGPALSGLRSVRMENAETVRVHIQAEGEGLYALIIPKSLSVSLSDISRSAQLFTAD